MLPVKPSNPRNQWRTRRGGGGDGRLPGLKNLEQTLFSGQAQVAQKSWKIKNISIQWKISGQILFFRASRLFKILNDKKYIFSTVNSGHTLFFRASTSCSKILDVKTILNTVKNFRKNSVFRASASSSKILISVQWKISGQTPFFRASASCSTFWRTKNTFSTMNSGHTLFFRARSSSSKILKDKNISMQWKISVLTLFFRARASC